MRKKIKMIDPKIKKEIERNERELKKFDVEKIKKEAIESGKGTILATGTTNFCVRGKPGCPFDRSYVCIFPDGETSTLYEHEIDSSRRLVLSIKEPQ